MEGGLLRVTVVVPCYNEEARLPEAVYTSWLATDASHARLLFVDDGSRDETLRVLRRICDAAPAGRAGVLPLGTNVGKAEAVRRGLLHVLKGADNPSSGSASPPDVVGFWDADLATPLPAIAQLTDVLQVDPSIAMVFAARVALLGRHIQRSPLRHYLGRCFATLASLTLDLTIYDTQCGAKLFRVSPTLRTVVAAPFLTGWVFDCEMLARFAALHAGGRASGAAGGAALAETIYEFPLDEWVDVAGSKLRLRNDILRMALGLLTIRSTYFWHEWPSGRRKPELMAAFALIGGCAVMGVLCVVALGYALLHQFA